MNKTPELTEDVRLGDVTAAIDAAFTDEDLYFRAFYFDNLLNLKWLRATILQSGLT